MATYIVADRGPEHYFRYSIQRVGWWKNEEVDLCANLENAEERAKELSDVQKYPVEVARFSSGVRMWDF